MSDHPKEAERNLKRIRICDDIYFDVFRLLAPAKVGLELALVSDRFDAFVDTHFKSRKWAFGKLLIYRKKLIKMNNNGPNKALPFPQKPLPNSIVGFSSVYICSITSAAIAFLQRIGRLFVSNVSLNLGLLMESNWNTFATSVWPLLNVFAIIKIHFQFGFQHFRRLISPSILCDCSNLRVISFISGQSLQFPPDHIEGSSDGQALCKWLHTPRADGQPKVLRSCWDGDEPSMDALKATFLNATTSVSFIIRLRVFVSSFGPFELINWLVRERLTCRQIDHADGNVWLIGRSPIDKNAEQWAEWEREASDDGTNEC